MITVTFAPLPPSVRGAGFVVIVEYGKNETLTPEMASHWEAFGFQAAARATYIGQPGQSINIYYSDGYTDFEPGPCPSVITDPRPMSDDFEPPAYVPCRLLAGHTGRHTSHETWTTELDRIPVITWGEVEPWQPPSNKESPNPANTPT